MIITDKLNVLNDAGDLNPNDEVVFSRTKYGTYYNRLVIRGIENIGDNVKLDVDGRDLVICRETDEDAPAQVVYLGKRFGVVHGASVKLQVIFLDDAMFINILSGFVDIGEDGNPFYYVSYLNNAEEKLLEGNAVLQTNWVTYDNLLSVLNALVKNKYFVVETLYEMEITNKNGVVSYKTLNKYDLSNGRVEELEREEHLRKEEKERQRRERKIKEMELRKKKQLEERANRNADIRAAFDRMLNRG
jgi:hypothetical protein